jgi:hypothetical protein
MIGTKGEGGPVPPLRGDKHSSQRWVQGAQFTCGEEGPSSPASLAGINIMLHVLQSLRPSYLCRIKHNNLTCMYHIGILMHIIH